MVAHRDMSVRSAGKMPLYAVVAERLRSQIVGGHHPVGSRLPTELELAAQFSVGRHTVREAIRMLRDEQLVAPRQGSGTVVLPYNTSASFGLEGQSINDLIAHSSDIRIEIETTAMELVQGVDAERIGVSSGDDWLVVRGMVVASEDGEPVCSSTHYINRAYASIARMIPRSTGPVFLLLEDMFAIRVTMMEQRISATEITKAEAGRLGVAAGSPAIQVVRTFRSANDSIVQITLHKHPAARFQHYTQLSRVTR